MLKQWCIGLLLLLLPPTGGQAGAVQAKNTILIIANSEYEHVANLPNPVNDATLAFSTFAALGFQTSVLIDAGAVRMRQALADFQRSSEDAEVAAIYFAGHGIQANNVNYLVASDTAADSLGTFRETSVALNEFLGAFAETSKVRLLIIDACRDNPFAQTRSLKTFFEPSTQGLSRVNHEMSNLLVVYSAQPNRRALDGDGSNSPFMEALSEILTSQANVKLSDALIDVTNLVRTKTVNRQSPYTEGSISVHVEFNLNFVPADKAASSRLCSGPAEEIPFQASPEEFLELAAGTTRMVTADKQGRTIEVCIDGSEVVVDGPFDARYGRADLLNKVDEGVGYFFDAAENLPAHLWLYVDPQTPDSPVEIGFYLDNQEIKWIETPWILKAAAQGD